MIDRIHESMCLISSAKVGIEMWLSTKDLWRTLLSNDLDPHELPGKPTKFKKKKIQE